MNEVKRCGIYSFPKSGNTWMRELLRAIFDISDSTSDSIPDIYEKGVNGKTVIADDGQKWMFYKSHSKNEVTKYKEQQIKNDLIIYIVRNPYDVFCSQLNYVLRGFEKNKGRLIVTCESVDEAKEKGVIDDYFSAFSVYGTLDPYFWDAGNWIENVSYWLKRADESKNVIVIRYEDMVSDIVTALKPITEALGVDEEKITSAFKLADSRTNDGGKFFWKKSSGTYRRYLNKRSIEKFKIFHSDIIETLGYTDL